jgi:hypothetical protein
MLSGRLPTRCLLVLGGLIIAAQAGMAQVLNSTARPIALNATLAESVSVTLSASSVNFILTSGSASNPGSTNITSTMTWTLRPSRGTLSLYAFFASSTAALTDGVGDNIPSSAFSISDNAGPFNPLVNTVPFGGANAGLTLTTIRILGFNKTGTHTDDMRFNINLTSLPSLPPGTYTGTLTIQAQAI